MNYRIYVFIIFVFLAVLLLSYSFIGLVLTRTDKIRKRIEYRLDELSHIGSDPTVGSIVRQKYISQLSPLERMIESWSWMERLGRFIQQSGKGTSAYLLLLQSSGLAIVGLAVSWFIFYSWWVSIPVTILSCCIPFYRVYRERAKRLNKFEEQLPEAIDLIQRALKAGHPFSQTLKIVSDSMDDPIATEFDITFSDISFSGDVRRAMLGLLERVPILSVMVLATAVSLQRETGGNLAESLGQLSSVIRSRFKFQRKLKTLSAEGKLSGYILISMPIFLFVFMWMFSHDYIARLIHHPMGPTLLKSALALAFLGLLWIKRLIRIEA